MYQAHIDEDLPFVSAQDSGLACGAMLAIVLCLSGYPDSALQRMRSTLVTAEALGPFNLAYVHTYAAMLYQLCGEPDAAAEHAATAIDISRKYGFPNWECAASMHLGIARSAQGRAEEGHALLEGGLGIWRAMGAESFCPYFLYGFAESLLALGRSDEALVIVDQGLDHADRHNHRLCDAMLYNLRGTIAMGGADPDLSIAEPVISNPLCASPRNNTPVCWNCAQRYRCTVCDRTWAMTRISTSLVRTRYERIAEGATTREMRDAAMILDPQNG